MSSTPPPIRETEWTHLFSPEALADGSRLAKQGRVPEMEWDPEISSLTAVVEDGDGEDHLEEVDIEVRRSGRRLRADTMFCTCPSEAPCQHIAAVLYAASQGAPVALFGTAPPTNSPPPGPRTEVRSWIAQLMATTQPAAPVPGTGERIFYVLEPSGSGPRTALTVRVVKSRTRKDGTYGPPTGLSLVNFLKPTPARIVQAVDVRIARLALANRGFADPYAEDHIHLSGEGGAAILGEVLATQRCHWGDPRNPMLRRGPQRTARPAWHRDPTGQVLSTLAVSPEATHVLPLRPPWYIDLGRNEVGPIETEMPTPLGE